ncbi:MAG: M15 family metallopeptidase [Oscillospiraceae bacterium]|nr:M15 family metallopeptidase [Oscillospiraceae bacterium]
MNKRKPYQRIKSHSVKHRNRSGNLSSALFRCIITAIIIIGAVYLLKIINPDKQKHSLSSTGINDISTDSVNNTASSENTVSVDNKWYLMLVNKWNIIPDGYQFNLTKLSGGESVDSRIYPALQEMLDTAKKDGVYAVVVSGYRTSAIQQDLLDNKVAAYKDQGYGNDEAKALAEAWVAVPGTSEHQIGLAVDINADGIHSAGYEVYDWLNKNSYRYGFICRYPADKTKITGVINEPWHYRYVGINVATEIHNRGICLEEYLNKTN